MQRFGDQILVVVDSCQLRCSPEQVRADLDAGFMVMLTGSKFAGGPPFAGALLLPPGIVDRLRLLSLPMGIFAYSAAGDWPAILRGAVQGGFAAPANIGLGLRWEAALAELEAVFSLEAGLRHRIVVRFGDVVRQLTTSCASFALIDHHAGALAHPTIFPVVSLAPAGTPVAAEAVYRALRSPLQSDTSDVGGRVYHVGQPVAVGRRQALRVCLSAPHMIDVGARLRRGGDFEEAFAPLAADLNALFLKWLTITSRSGHAPGALLRA